MTDILSVPVAERDRLAAVKMLGWDSYAAGLFKASNSALDDYLILRKVRETWSEEYQKRFVFSLIDITSDRASFNSRTRNSANFNVLFYEPGDYRDAALITLAANGEI